MQETFKICNQDSSHIEYTLRCWRGTGKVGAPAGYIAAELPKWVKFTGGTTAETRGELRAYYQASTHRNTILRNHIVQRIFLPDKSIWTAKDPVEILKTKPNGNQPLLKLH